MANESSTKPWGRRNYRQESASLNASRKIDEQIASLGDWRGGD